MGLDESLSQEKDSFVVQGPVYVEFFSKSSDHKDQRGKGFSFNYQKNTERPQLEISSLKLKSNSFKEDISLYLDIKNTGFIDFNESFYLKVLCPQFIDDFSDMRFIRNCMEKQVLVDKAILTGEKLTLELDSFIPFFEDKQGINLDLVLEIIPTQGGDSLLFGKDIFKIIKKVRIDRLEESGCADPSALNYESHLLFHKKDSCIHSLPDLVVDSMWFENNIIHLQIKNDSSKDIAYPVKHVISINDHYNFDGSSDLEADKKGLFISAPLKAGESEIFTFDIKDFSIKDTELSIKTYLDAFNLLTEKNEDNNSAVAFNYDTSNTPSENRILSKFSFESASCNNPLACNYDSLATNDWLCDLPKKNYSCSGVCLKSEEDLDGDGICDIDDQDADGDGYSHLNDCDDFDSLRHDDCACEDSKSSYEYGAKTGDVNNDKVLNILDILDIVSCILGEVNSCNTPKIH